MFKRHFDRYGKLKDESTTPRLKFGAKLKSSAYRNGRLHPALETLLHYLYVGGKVDQFETIPPSEREKQIAKEIIHSIKNGHFNFLDAELCTTNVVLTVLLSYKEYEASRTKSGVLQLDPDILSKTKHLGLLYNISLQDLFLRRSRVPTRRCIRSFKDSKRDEQESDGIVSAESSREISDPSLALLKNANSFDDRTQSNLPECSVSLVRLETLEEEELVDDKVTEKPEEMYVDITDNDLETLEGRNWLNDRVVDEYMKLLTKHKPEILAATSFLYIKLEADDFDTAKCWIRNIFSYKRIMIPVCENEHWKIVLVDLETSVIWMYNSIKDDDKTSLLLIKKFLHFYASADSLPPREWKLEIKQGLPEQRNNHDCGVYVLEFARAIVEDRIPKFTQTYITKARKQIKSELQRLRSRK